jgi:hypothetical protein
MRRLHMYRLLSFLLLVGMCLSLAWSTQTSEPPSPASPPPEIEGGASEAAAETPETRPSDPAGAGGGRSPRVKLSDAIAAMALLISITGFWVARREAQRAPMINYLSALSSVEAQIAKTPTVLKFHGIDPGELERRGVSAEEFAYLVTSFTLGGVWHTAYWWQRGKTYKRGDYRYAICAAEATRKAWPLLRKMMEKTPYRDRIEATIEATRPGR